MTFYIPSRETILFASRDKIARYHFYIVAMINYEIDLKRCHWRRCACILATYDVLIVKSEVRYKILFIVYFISRLVVILFVALSIATLYSRTLTWTRLLYASRIALINDNGRVTNIEIDLSLYDNRYLTDSLSISHNSVEISLLIFLY